MHLNDFIAIGEVLSLMTCNNDSFMFFNQITKNYIGPQFLPYVTINGGKRIIE